MHTSVELLKTLLWEEWDPIGVNDAPEGRDEYDRYALALNERITDGASEDEVTDYLTWVETEYMGLDSLPESPARNRSIAVKAIAIVLGDGTVMASRETRFRTRNLRRNRG